MFSINKSNLIFLTLIGGPERFNPVDALDIRVQCVNSNAYFEWKLTGKYPVSHVNLEYTCINVSSGHHHIVSTTFLQFYCYHITWKHNILQKNFCKTSLKIRILKSICLLCNIYCAW